MFGICGGLQLLGRELLDPQGLEGGDCAAGEVVAGLDLLPLRTRFGGRKALRQRQSTARWPGEGLSLEGFELHRGLSSPIETAGPLQPSPPIQSWAIGTALAKRVVWWLAPTCMGYSKAGPGGAFGSTNFASVAAWLPCRRTRPTTAGSETPS